MPNPIGVCKNCGKHDVSLVESHIVPDFMYEGLFDSKHRAYQPLYDEGKWDLVQDGFKRNFLCDDCEDLFDPLDKYAASIFTLNGPSNSNVRVDWKTSSPSGRPLTVEQWSGIDFRKCQNFVFGVIQRTVLSGIHEQEVLKSEEYRKMISIAEDVSSDDMSFPILIVKLKKDRFQPGVMIPNRVTVKAPNGAVYETVYFKGGGHLLQMIVSEKVSAEANTLTINTLKLKSDGTAWIIERSFTSTGPFESWLAKSAVLPRPRTIHK